MRFSVGLLQSILALIVATSALPLEGEAATTALDKRQGIPTANLVTCNFVLQPTAAVDPTNINELNFEFSNVIIDAFENSSTPTGIVVNFGTTFSANLDANNTFNVQDEFGSQRLSAATSIPIIESWVGTTLPGFTSNWIVNSASCQ
ncbi:hypothetical protein D9613_005818 [Agrocybe pediades]|uniref:Uncharacterized protein n=1 Tax=Agrocybe pediades TaxID=84607 RepID=A0A8H4VP16_9AGAR|nr:hypothetical protein D9613_005818 [Agrocybe pediades]KAF9561815.1 hypothetical protein CPC08DRAFT_707185 [Agrocybe pediades]